MKLGDTAIAPPASGPFDWLPNVVNAIGIGLTLTNQQKLAKLNIERAKQGLPPISMDAIPGAVPTVAVGVDQGTRNMLLLGGAGLLGFLALKHFSKRRR